MKKGFTLIELLSIIIILIGIMVIVFPKITGSVKKQDLAINNVNEEIIYRAADLYVGDNSSKYRKINGEYSCISIKELEDKKYLKYGLKKYDGTNLEYDTVQVEYNNGFRYSLTDHDSCITVIKEEEKCTDKTKCNICYVSKVYNNGVYKYEGKILEGENISLNYSNSDNFKGYTTTYGCEILAVKEATKEFVNNDRENYPADDGNTYCISLKNKLLPKGHIKDTILNDSNINIVDNYVSEVKYDDGTEIINIVESSSCKTQRWDTPKLSDGLVPVKYVKSDPNNYTMYDYNYVKRGGCSEKTNYPRGNWVVADPNDKWYDYDKQWWPNAILLKQGVSKKVGDVINLSSEAVGMFVWVPKYEYKLTGGYKTEILVNLIKKKNYQKTEGYTIPPAFTFGDNNISGFWAGKFLTNYSVYEYSTLPGKDLNGLDTFINDQIFNFSKKNNLDSDLFDSHIMKISEQAALVYLSQSKYGKWGNYYDYKKLHGNFNSKSVLVYASGHYENKRTGYMQGRAWPPGGIRDDSANRYYNDDHEKTIYCEQTSPSYIYPAGQGNKNNISLSKKQSQTLTYEFTVNDISKISFSYAGSSVNMIHISYSLEGPTSKSDSKALTKASKKQTEEFYIEPGSYVIKFAFENKSSVLSTSGYLQDLSIANGGWNDVIKNDYQNGIGGSTTGNIYGVYDINLYNQVVAATSYSDSRSLSTSLSSIGMSKWNSKYYDYFYTNVQTEPGKTTVFQCNGSDDCNGYGLIKELNDDKYFENCDVVQDHKYQYLNTAYTNGILTNYLMINDDSYSYGPLCYYAGTSSGYGRIILSSNK